MKFHNFKLLTSEDRSDHYWSGLFNDDLTSIVIGKVRPWDSSCREYILYEDGDIILAELIEEDHHAC